MICKLCGKRGLKSREVTRSYGTGANLLVIENIPAKSCPHCGETYFKMCIRDSYLKMLQPPLRK